MGDTAQSLSGKYKIEETYGEKDSSPQTTVQVSSTRVVWRKLSVCRASSDRHLVIDSFHPTLTTGDERFEHHMRDTIATLAGS